MTDSLGTTTWVFDDLNRMVSVTDPHCQSVTNEFDAVGNRVALTYPGNLAVRYGYDSLNRMAALTNWIGGVVGYAYDNRGNLVVTTNANSTTAMYGYDVGSRIVALTNAGVNASVIAGYALTLDGIGNHLESSQAQPLYPLLPNQTNHYSYDSDKRLTLADGKTVTHDNNGNFTGIGSEIFSYDFENRLIQFTLTNSTGACVYDGAGNRLDGLLMRTPVIGPIYETWFRRSTTYFQHDTRVVFLKLMDDLVKARVDEETSAKGVTLLSCFEHQPILDGLYKTSKRTPRRGDAK